MDFQELLHAADRNKAEASYEASVKRFSTDLPPPKKVSKNGVMSDNIAKFLAKRKAEEEAKAAEARKQREKLLALRAQSTKNNKKAKIMASRTKDNDFSKIKLTDDEIEAKRKREAALLRQNLSNKVERMKARIELEEKEKMLPRKRKRKNKVADAEPTEDQEEQVEIDASPEHKISSDTKRDGHSRSSSEKNSQIRKTVPKAAAAPAISFAELLKVAAKKQFEPLEIVPKKKEEEKPLTKKEKKILMEEKEREKRKKERLLMGDLGLPKPNGVVKNNQKGVASVKREDTKGKPVVIRLEKDNSKPSQHNGKVTQKVKPCPSQTKSQPLVGGVSKSGVAKSNVNMQAKSNHGSELKSNKSVNVKKPLSKNREKKSSASAAQSSQAVPKFDEDAFAAALEKRLREKMEKEIEQKLMSKLGLLNGSSSAPNNPDVKKEPSVSKPPVVKKEPPGPSENGRKPISKSTLEAKREYFMAMKKRAMEQKRAAARPPEKKTFHLNPYLEPPRRLLEPQIRRPPPKRIESSDEEDDDDLSDFIDDGPSTQNEENYSEYIKEIFGYDKNKYFDDDDDAEAMESSFVQQMKEEHESTKAGMREDLEEERKELERRKRKKLKNK